MKHAQSAVLPFVVLATGTMQAEETRGGPLRTAVGPCAHATGSDSTDIRGVFPGLDWTEAMPESQQVDSTHVVTDPVASSPLVHTSHGSLLEPFSGSQCSVYQRLPQA